MTSTGPVENDVAEKTKRRIFTPHLYFLLWCGCIVSQSMLVSGFLNVVLSTIQVEFQMTSAKAAMFPSNYDIAVATTVLVVAHFGSTHKPRTLGAGMVILATGSFLFALPHFLYARDEIITDDSDKQYLCTTNSSNSSEVGCTAEDAALSNPGAYYLLTIGSVMIGLGASPVYTAGTTFCDEIFPPDKVSLYFGISYGIGALAPAMGFVLGGVFLGYYKTLGDAPDGITPDSANWVGAWWMGFLVTAALGYIFGFILLLFPRQLPECEEVKRKKLEINIQTCSDEDLNQTFMELLQDALPLLKKILLNPVFVLVVIGSITDSLIVSAFAAWLPLMVESQFGLSSSTAAFITGGVVVPGAAGGIIISGLIVKIRKLSGIQCAKYQAWIGVACIIAQLGLLIHCPTLQIDGENVPTNTTCLQYSETCDACPGSDIYEPVCIDGTTYRSPCHAGCLNFNVTEYTECCGGQIATPGACETGCKLLIPFIFVLFLIMFCTFLNNVFFLTVNLRCVKDNERVMAISLQSFAFRVFGSFPGPIILGSFIDKACILWNENTCGDEGACQEYNNTQIMAAAIILASSAKILGTILYFIGWRVWEARETPVAYHSDLKNGAAVTVNVASAENLEEPAEVPDTSAVVQTTI